LILPDATCNRGMECTKCGGKGRIAKYSHIEKGICFRCWGLKIEPTTIEELEAWLKRARSEYRARRDEAQKATSEARKRFLVAELGWIEKSGKAVAVRLQKLRSSGRCKAIVALPVAIYQSVSSEKEYELRQATDGSHYCTCPAWKYQRKPVKERSCKHIQQFLKEKERKAGCINLQFASQQPKQLKLMFA